MRPLARYSTLVFDCDGVILDSNRIKTEAFHQVARPFGEPAADALVAFHVANGGISRYRKFRYFLGEILGCKADDSEVKILAEQYGEVVFESLMHCAVTPGLEQLRLATEDQGWMIVSGGDQAELREVFSRRGLGSFFDRGIFGSPATKDEILPSAIAAGHLTLPALFVGDSRYDHEAASRAGLDFVFASAWTEFHGWGEYCKRQDIGTVHAVVDLLNQY